MTDYSNILTSTDLDAYRSDGVIYNDSLTFSGTLGGSDSQVKTTTGFTIPNIDFYQLLFDNSQKHSGKWRDMNLESRTLILETTSSSELTALIQSTISDNVLTVKAEVFNAYSTSVTLQTTTLNFRFVGYDTTILAPTGTKATGSIGIMNCDWVGGFTIPAGTVFVSLGYYKAYVSTSTVVVPTLPITPPSTCVASPFASQIQVPVEAVEAGSMYNIPPDNFYFIDSFYNTGVRAISSTSFTGGS